MTVKIYTTSRTPEGEVSTSAPVAEIIAEAGKYLRAAIIVEPADGIKRWTPQQRKWWQGILLAKLAEFTGDSKGYWENELKLGVMPDVFHLICSHIDGRDHRHVPSITILNRKEMREMIEGSVAYLRDEKRYGTKFHWVTLPDKDLRS